MFGFIICWLKGHKWNIDKEIEVSKQHKIKYKSCKRCSADNYRDC